MTLLDFLYLFAMLALIGQILLDPRGFAARIAENRSDGFLLAAILWMYACQAVTLSPAAMALVRLPGLVFFAISLALVLRACWRALRSIWVARRG